MCNWEDIVEDKLIKEDKAAEEDKLIMGIVLEDIRLIKEDKAITGITLASFKEDNLVVVEL
eukprot:CAMPEP_0168315130 /NCGR_PEP_ID=MMETSP0210-20121227/10240_1 /TAXON_ID=40633 /ORGANISM="Condylostoma magnum, Strain COL2" /LENGTH=60 /DNA_ID=CAMNT_0008286593 /DNA_START=150 /DNA_END=332 /DNA_ORIENTATION=-